MIIVLSASTFAHGKDPKHDKWMREMRQAKLEFMIKELQISTEQKAKFTETYNAMEAELDKLRSETDAMRRSIDRKKDASDLEYEKAAEAMFEFKLKEGNIEKKYFDRLKATLSPHQLFNFKKAEMKWMRKLMKHRKN